VVSRVKRWERRREGIREGRLGRIGEGSRNGEGRWVIRSAIVTRSLKRRIVELVIEFSSISNWTSLFPFFLINFFFADFGLGGELEEFINGIRVPVFVV